MANYTTKTKKVHERPEYKFPELTRKLAEINIKVSELIELTSQGSLAETLNVSQAAFNQYVAKLKKEAKRE